jgi:hypothetical protein
MASDSSQYQLWKPPTTHLVNSLPKAQEQKWFHAANPIFESTTQWCGLRHQATLGV